MKTVVNYRLCLKKFLVLFLAGIMFFSTVINVYAKTLTIEDVSNQFKHSTIIEELAKLGSTITSEVNLTNKTLDIYAENEKVFSFVYGDDYIEYNDRNTVVTEENYADDISIAIWTQSIIESVFTLSGHKDKTLSEDATYTDTYDTYGIQLEIESYSFSGSDENGGSWNISGDHIKYFKISLDTDKIDALITKYGVDIDEQAPNKEIIANLVPTIEAKNITENSVTIYPKINYYNTDSDYIVNCHIYRSDSENGSYERISDLAVNCLDGVGLIDEGLKSNTTYYYKAIIVDGEKFSNPLAITTKGGSTIVDTNTDKNSKEEITKNPSTGVTFSIVTLMLVLIISLAVAIYIKKKSFLKQL